MTQAPGAPLESGNGKSDFHGYPFLLVLRERYLARRLRQRDGHEDLVRDGGAVNALETARADGVLRAEEPCRVKPGTELSATRRAVLDNIGKAVSYDLPRPTY